MQIYTNDHRRELKAHGDFSFPVNITAEQLSKYERGAFLWHWHPEIELTLIERGQIEYRVNAQSYLLKEGEGLFCNSNTLHSGQMRDGNDCTYRTITFHPRFIYGYENSCLESDYVSFITENDSWCALRFLPSVDWQQSILEEIKKIVQLWDDQVLGSTGYEMDIHISLCRIWRDLWDYFRKQPNGNQTSWAGLERLRQMIAFIQENYAQTLTLDMIADHVGLCKSECCRFFKKHMHMTIFQYLLYYRVQQSLVWLRSGESVTRTAQLTGFSDACYFGKVFKDYMGCTPKAYQKKSGHPNHMQ